MTKLIGELLFELVRILIRDLVTSFCKQIAVKVCAWIDSRVHGRTARFVLGGLLGIVAYFAYPIILGLLGL